LIPNLKKKKQKAKNKKTKNPYLTIAIFYCSYYTGRKKHQTRDKPKANSGG